jgi:hypothetical protein
MNFIASFDSLIGSFDPAMAVSVAANYLWSF